MRLCILATVASLVGLAVAPNNANGAKCVRQRIVRQVQVQQVVQPFIQQEYVAPLISSYSQAIAVPYQYQYFVGQSLREDAVADRIAQLVLQKLQAPRQVQANKAQPEECPTCHKATQPAPVEPPADPPADTDELTTLRDAVNTIVQTSCIKCHGPESTNGLDLSDLSKVDELSAWKMWGLTHAGTMPKNADPISDVDVETIRAWVTAKYAK